jgi:hypothetical protein
MNTVTIAIESDSSIAGSITNDLKSMASGEIIVGKANNLDGSGQTTLQIVQVAISMISALTPILLYYLESRRIKKIKIGDIEIENPTPDQCRQLLDRYRSSTSSDQ